MSFLGTISVASALLVLAGGPPNPPPLTLRDALQICGRIQNRSDRLTCLEDLAKSPASAASAGSTPNASTSVRKAPMTASERRAAETIRRRADEEDKPAHQTYAAVVNHAWESAGDNYISLASGEVWKSEAHDVGRPIKDGEEVELSPGFGGSWFMKFKTLRRPTIQVMLIK